jgi:hypothetical protein
MSSNRLERQTDDDVQAIKSGLTLPHIQTPNFSVGDESIHLQHNLKVFVRFPKSHSVQALVVSWVYLKVIHLRKTLHYCHKKMHHEGKLLLLKKGGVMKNKMNSAVIWHYYIFLQEGFWRVYKQEYLSWRCKHTKQQYQLVP